MRLIVKTTLFYLLISLIVFSIGGVAALRLIRLEVDNETDYSLRDSYLDARQAIERGVSLSALNTRKVRIDSIPIEKIRDTTLIFSDTLGPHPRLDTSEPYRMLTTKKVIKGQGYHFVIQDVFLELDDSYGIVVKIMTRLFLLLGGISVLVMFVISRVIFRPFRITLRRIEDFNVTRTDTMPFPRTSTWEFKHLNRFIGRMMQKAQRDYRALKEFAENASHEIQTPLAIAQGKLELLMETEGMNRQQIEFIQSAQASLGRLSKTSEALLLLTRIENQALIPKNKTDLSKVTRQLLGTFRDLAALRGIGMTIDVDDEVEVAIEPALSEIMISNLLKNAVRHNYENGWIRVNLDHQGLVIANTGAEPTIPIDQLFDRFQTLGKGNHSMGLGLAIVQKICEIHKYDIKYTFDDGIHRLNVNF